MFTVWRTQPSFNTRESVSYTHLRAHETPEHLVCRLLLEKKKNIFFFFLMIRRPPRSTLDRSSAASDVYKRQTYRSECLPCGGRSPLSTPVNLSLIHISEPTRLLSISYAVFCLKKKKIFFFFF